jgi:hypothetical protein
MLFQTIAQSTLALRPGGTPTSELVDDDADPEVEVPFFANQESSVPAMIPFPLVLLRHDSVVSISYAIMSDKFIPPVYYL